MLYVLVAVVLMGLLAAVVPVLLRRGPRNEVERFHHARRLTTGWASQAGGVLPVAQRQPDDADEPAGRAG